MTTIAVIDYGSGNLRSVAKALQAVATATETILVTQNASEASTADRIVLPGVGAFADCWRGLNALPDMVPSLRHRVLVQGAPFLGICVGMQLLATTGYEHEVSPGLGWLGGEVRNLPRPADGKIPHMGWNNVLFDAPASPLFRNITDATPFYFVHSYILTPAQPTQRWAHCHYGQDFAAVVGQDNLCGTQFHPEKSQASGLQLLRNFLDWQPE
ncbi:MAG: imidazole glycerol phosphate synthase subunit HisH [Alphaproteobacteria bacterium]|nr:imidazole glycerol phosphate synthase subunit HisH [Alphaproteobacteria bacterium]